MKKKILKLIFIFGIIFSGAWFGGTDVFATSGSIGINNDYISIDETSDKVWYDEAGTGTITFHSTGSNSGTFTIDSYSFARSIWFNDVDEHYDLSIIVNGTNSINATFYLNSNIDITFSGNGSLQIAAIDGVHNAFFNSGDYTINSIYATGETRITDGSYSVKTIESSDITITGGIFTYLSQLRFYGDNLIVKNVTLTLEDPSSFGYRIYDGKNVVIENSTINFQHPNLINFRADESINIKDSTIRNTTIISDNSLVADNSYFYNVTLYSTDNITLNGSHFDGFEAQMNGKFVANDTEFKNAGAMNLAGEAIFNNCDLDANYSYEDGFFGWSAFLFDNVEFNNSNVKVVSPADGNRVSVLFDERLYINGGSFEIDGANYGINMGHGIDDYAPATFYNANIYLHNVNTGIDNYYGGVFIEGDTTLTIEDVADYGIRSRDLYIEGGLTTIKNADIGISYYVNDYGYAGTFMFTGGEIYSLNSDFTAFEVPYNYDYDDDGWPTNLQPIFTLTPNMTYEIPNSTEEHHISFGSEYNYWGDPIVHFGYLPDSIIKQGNSDIALSHFAKNIHFYQTSDNPNISSDLTVHAVIPAEISLELSSDNIEFLIDSPTLKTDSIVITADTNAEEGYTISFKTDDETNALVSTSAQIPSLDKSYAAANFPTNGWGYSIDEGANYDSIPMTNYNIFSTNTNGENSHEFGIGIRADFREVLSDTYTNNLIFTAVVNL